MAMESIRIELITESPLNPRKHFDPAKMAELTQSIKERGVDTPVLVRPDGPGYQLVSGHRRRRAARLGPGAHARCGLLTPPKLAKSVDGRTPRLGTAPPPG